VESCDLDKHVLLILVKRVLIKRALWWNRTIDERFYLSSPLFCDRKMPESETEFLDYYPSGWTEHIHDEYYIEWVFDDDETIFVRLDGTMGEEYSVIPITGVNEDGEEFVTKPISQLSREDAFEVASTLIYAMNGTIGRLNKDPEFTGDDIDT